LLLAISGGQDSLCLLKLLLDLQPKWGWQLAIAHCDHGWPTDTGIAAQVEQIATQVQLPFWLARTENLPETEAAARHWRYAALLKLAEAHHFPYLLTAHTQSDRAETLLYNLVRGAGMDGLQSLTWQRQLSAQVQLVRPLLNMTRSMTGEFCARYNLPVWHDVLNRDRRYARVRMRETILPQLRTLFNPQAEVAIAQTAELLTAEVDYLQTQTAELWSTVYDPECQALRRDRLQTVHLALQRRILRQFWHTQIRTMPTFAQIDACVQLIAAPNQSRTATLPGGLWLVVERSWLRWQRSDSGAGI
jgi:tRNA(Ile)-lysidine synthase